MKQPVVGRKGVLVGLGLLLIYLTGPLPLLAYGLQRWAALSRWDWRDRWASIRAFALVSGLCSLSSLLLLFLPPFAPLLHAIAIHWQQVPLLGSLSLWPPGLGDIAARWLFAQPLAPTLALLLERFDPRSGPQHLMRVRLPSEEIPVQPAPEETSAPPPKAKRKRTTTTKPAKNASRAQTTASPTTLPAEPPAAQGSLPSLWDQVDWSTVPDSNPLKQQAMEEARQHKGMRIQAPPEIPPAQAPPQAAPKETKKKRIDFTQVDE